MKLASKVILLIKGVDGFGPSISDALRPNPNSSLTRTETSFEISLERYGIKDHKASGDIIAFVDSQGLSQVSILLLQNYEPPVAACAVNEILSSIILQSSCDNPTFILPYIARAPKLKKELTRPTSATSKVVFYGTLIGPTTDFTEAMIVGLQEPPISLQVHYETLACLLQLVRALKLPTVLLVGSSSPSRDQRTRDQDLEALKEVGEFLANHADLCFSKDEIRWNPKEKSRGTQEPWRALYG
eukprot:TRINITY_DN19392_c0_g1_i1.p1 TRINITY_DN19392_c0_g1~~TRINITY_DN19392_c0_g1_i1.p1  ORF type:complete len:243 (+),score=33.40 TRINITY_DN19392_c0_g1_i1:84-812(+)